MGIAEANLEKSISVEQIIKAYTSSDNSSEKAIFVMFIELLEKNKELKCWTTDIIPGEEIEIELIKLISTLHAVVHYYKNFKWDHEIEIDEKCLGLKLGKIHKKISPCTCEEIICICINGKHYYIPLDLILFNKVEIQNLMKQKGLQKPDSFRTKEVEKIKVKRVIGKTNLYKKTLFNERKKLNREPTNNEVWDNLKSYDSDNIIEDIDQNEISFEGSNGNLLKTSVKRTAFNNQLALLRKEFPEK